ncbi:hypothetical protein BpHYR1_033090 [Brachionus plicatilis]|uniref:Uncharacterized protein n=1 Tax=Brachionus plicatilis TaxID=10195 RepID=A0A3M7RIS4_BRAPC|nr:hypothetical protein BpHYR1_033090 [Brachionus plicatilis]
MAKKLLNREVLRNCFVIKTLFKFKINTKNENFLYPYKRFSLNCKNAYTVKKKNFTFFYIIKIVIEKECGLSNQ